MVAVQDMNRAVLVTVLMVVCGLYVFIFGLAGLFSAVFIIPGLLAYNSLQQGRLGSMGKIGLGLLVLVALAGSGVGLLERFNPEMLERYGVEFTLVFGALFVVGTLLFGLGAARARLTPAISGGLLAVSGPMVLLLGAAGRLIFLLSMAMAGFYVIKAQLDLRRVERND